MAAYFDPFGAMVTVTDEYGQLWSLTREIGSGGQGRVWLAAGGRTAVKIVDGWRRQAEAEAMYARLQRVRRLPLEDIRIAGVQSMLKPPKVGYTMELAGEMVELGRLHYPPARADFGEWYQETGGLARRLRLTARLADTVARLHSRGIAFGDLSPGNVMVSESAEHDEIRLIDVDNLTVRATAAEPGVFTPGYGAPELVSGSATADTLADAHALATVVFETLTTVHPFRGDLVMEGPPEFETQADEYLLPWIDHPDDRRNTTEEGIGPRDELLTARLRALFQRAFVDGLADPLSRPTAAEWASALYAAADQIATCRHCGWTFRVMAGVCLKCRLPRDEIRVLRYMMAFDRELAEGAMPDGAPVLTAPLPELTVLSTDWENRILARHAMVAPGDPEEPVAGLRLAGEHTTVVNHGSRPLWIDRGDGRDPVECRQGMSVSARTSGWSLHFGPMGSTHRWAIVKKV